MNTQNRVHNGSLKSVSQNRLSRFANMWSVLIKIYNVWFLLLRSQGVCEWYVFKIRNQWKPDPSFVKVFWCQARLQDWEKTFESPDSCLHFSVINVIRQRTLFQCYRFSAAVSCYVSTSLSYVPVVPAGTISLRCLSTSSLLEDLASRARQRINPVVSGSGFSREERSSCRLSCSWTTTPWASHDLRMSLTKARDLCWSP